MFILLMDAILDHTPPCDLTPIFDIFLIELEALNLLFLNGKVDCIRFYTRNQNGECRLSIRKSLMEFEGKEVETILQWFRVNFNLLKNAIEENYHE